MTLHHGDCLEVMREMSDASVDAIVTDPPYGLGFMGKHWDHGAPGPDFWREMWRVAKPGAHLLAFGGTRTVHRIASSIEDAGWEIRDMLVWAYASGFPKSLDVSKALDKRAGHWRGRAGAVVTSEQPAKGTEYERTPKGDPVTAAAAAAAAAAAGWGTALKPAWEPIIMARKPLIGSVADNWLEHGTGALNIDGCRLPAGDTVAVEFQPRPTDDANASWSKGEHTAFHYKTSRRRAPADDAAPVGFGRGAEMGGNGSPLGRWPANVVLTDPIFDGGWEGVVGGGEAGGGYGVRGESGDGWGMVGTMGQVGYGDSGTYSRFFLIPKADRAEREPIVRGQLVERRVSAKPDGRQWDIPGSHSTSRENNHPTVKPIDLMRHLVRLVSPPGGIVLDPFLGSGTTAIAAEMEGFDWIGIEREAEYVAIAEARLNGTQRGLGLSEPAVRRGGGPAVLPAQVAGSTEGAA